MKLEISRLKLENVDLVEKLSSMESKLTDVMSYMESERGTSMQQIEQDLAEAKVRIAELESEKDFECFRKNSVSSA